VRQRVKVSDLRKGRVYLCASEEPLFRVQQHHRVGPRTGQLTLANLAYNFDRLIFHELSRDNQDKNLV
jgi:hypothetical protein